MLKVVKLKNISKLIGSGVTPLRSNSLYWDNGTISWLKTEQLGEAKIYDTTEKITQYAIEETGIKIFPINTISVAMYGEGRTRGNVSILKTEMTTNQACCNIVIDEKKADYEYVFYYLKTQYKQLRNLSSGVRKNLNSNDIKEFEIRLPKDLSTQRQIASVLSSLDAKIELNNRINAQLEAMAKTMYDYWFVQFDFPYSPPSEGLGVVKPYKSSGGKMVYNEQLKRAIPEGWEVKRIGDLATVKAGGDKPTNYSIEKTEINNIPIYSNGITNNGLYGYTNKSIINEQSITISARGTIGFCVLRNIPYVPIIRLISLIPNLNGSAKYFYETLKNFNFENSGSVQQQLTVPQVTDIKILYPNEKILKKFGEITAPMTNRTELLNEENQQLSQLRDWLLPMLMNGQVTVKDAYAMIDEQLSVAAEESVGYGK